jgi:hypothetical protein
VSLVWFFTSYLPFVFPGWGGGQPPPLHAAPRSERRQYVCLLPIPIRWHAAKSKRAIPAFLDLAADNLCAAARCRLRRRGGQQRDFGAGWATQFSQSVPIEQHLADPKPTLTPAALGMSVPTLHASFEAAASVFMLCAERRP